MFAKRLFSLSLAVLILGGCSGPTTLTLSEFTFKPQVSGPLKKGHIYYAEAKGDLIMGAIIYRVENPGPKDPELIVLANGVTESLWRKILPVLIAAGGQVAAAGIYGISLPTAKTIISTVANGGAGGANTNTIKNCNAGEDIDGNNNCQ